MTTRSNILLGLALMAACGIALTSISCTSQADFAAPPHQHTGTLVVPLVRPPAVPNMLFVNASVNGRQGLFLIDTGTSVCALDASFAKSIGLKTRPHAWHERLWQWAHGSNVKVETTVASADTLTVGNDVFESVPLVVLDLSHVGLSGIQLDGIIGLTILGETGCQFDVRQHQLILHPTEHVGRAVAMNWNDQTAVYTLDAQINGQMIPMVVDTGADATHISSREWCNLPTSAAVQTNTGFHADANGSSTNHPYRQALIDFRVGDVIWKDFWVLDGPSSLLGMDFFQRYIVTFDFKGGKAYFEEHSTNGTPSSAALPDGMSER